MGRLINIRSEAGAPSPVRIDVTVLWDWAPHDVALGLHLTGAMPTSAVCRKLISLEVPQGIAEQLELKMEFSNQVQMRTEIGTLFKEKRRWLRADFEHGTLILDDRVKYKVMKYEATDSTKAVDSWGIPLPFGSASPLENILSAFEKCINAGQPFLSDIALGTQVVEVLSTMDYSRRNHNIE